MYLESNRRLILFVPFFFFFNSDYEHCMGRGMEIRWLIKSDARDGIC